MRNKYKLRITECSWIQGACKIRKVHRNKMKHIPYLPTSDRQNEGHDPHLKMKMRVITRNNLFSIKNYRFCVVRICKIVFLDPKKVTINWTKLRNSFNFAHSTMNMSKILENSNILTPKTWKMLRFFPQSGWWGWYFEKEGDLEGHGLKRVNLPWTSIFS